MCEKFKSTEHNELNSPFYRWREEASLARCGSMHPCESRSVRPVQPCGTPGELGSGLICSMLPSSTAATAASQLALSPHTPFGVLAQWALLGSGFGRVGYRSHMNHWWGLLLSIPMWAGRKSQGDRCAYVPLVALTTFQDRCPLIWQVRRKRLGTTGIGVQREEGQKS